MRRKRGAGGGGGEGEEKKGAEIKPNKDKQRLLELFYSQGFGPSSFMSDRYSETGRGMESFIVEKGNSGMPRVEVAGTGKLSAATQKWGSLCNWLLA